MHDRAYYRQQLRLEIGQEAFDALPDREPRAPPRPPVQRRPRIEARQRLALSGLVPAVVAAGFTIAETAVLSVLAAEVKQKGRCDLTVGEIAYRAQACRTVVQNALRQAAHWGLISVEHRRIDRCRNLSNVVTITSRVWLAWIRLGPRRPRLWGGAGWISPRDRERGWVHGTERKPNPSYRKVQKGGLARGASGPAVP